MHRLLLILIVALVPTSVLHAEEYYTKDKVNKQRGTATEDMALVYVFRPASMGAAVKTWAFADDQFLAVSKAKGYSFALVQPGKRVFWAKAENTSGVEVEVEAGQTYYFKMSIKMGLGKARVKMVQIDETTAEPFFDKCGYNTPTEEGLQRAAEIAANRQDRAMKNADKKKANKG